MRQRDGRLNPFQSMLGQREAGKCGRTDGERMNRGTNIVDETGQGQLRRARSATDGRLSFNDCGMKPGFGERDGCSETVRSGADHKRVARLQRYCKVTEGWDMRVLRVLKEWRRE